MKTKPFLICFTGIDGSGKSTQSKNLTEYLKGRGIPTIYVWNRFEPRLLIPFFKIGKLLFFRGKDLYKDYTDFSRTQQRILGKSVIARIYQFLLTVDYALQIMLKIKIPLIRGWTVVCDRYVFDSAVDIGIDTGNPGKTKEMLEAFFRLTPKPDVTFLLDLPEHIALERKSDTPSLEYLKERRQLYLDMAEAYNMIVLDGATAPQTVEALVRKRIGKMIHG